MSHEIKHPSRDNERGKSKSKRLYGTSLASQRQRLLDHFKTSKTIHRHEADDKYSMCHLGVRICELRKIGYRIVTARKQIVDRNGVNHQHIAEYVFMGLPRGKSHE